LLRARRWGKTKSAAFQSAQQREKKKKGGVGPESRKKRIRERQNQDGGTPGVHLRDGEGSRELSFLLQGVCLGSKRALLFFFGLGKERNFDLSLLSLLSSLSSLCPLFSVFVALRVLFCSLSLSRRARDSSFLLLLLLLFLSRR
jgi:hypothetical protein